MVFHRSRRRISRKRALAGIGVSLVVASPLLTGPALASHVYQHRVGRAHRHVEYHHTIHRIPRGHFTGFWYPDDDAAGDNLSPQKEGDLSSMEILEHESGVLWSLVADAARQHPHGAPRVARQETTNSLAKHDSHTRDHNVRRRCAQVTETFAEDGASAILVEESPVSTSDHTDNAAADVELGMNSLPETEHGNSNSNYDGYNVTAQVLYDYPDGEVSYDANRPEGVGENLSSVFTSNSKTDGNATSVFQPLRIRAVLPEERDGGEFLSSSARSVLLERILQPALLTWSAALRVEPVQGNLTVDSRQLFDNITCGPGKESGLPSPRVPSSHLSEGVPNTDMIMYVSVGYTQEYINKTLKPARLREMRQNGLKNYTRWLLWDHTPGNPPPAESESLYSWSRQKEEEKEESDIEVDMSDVPLCSGDYTAAATYCSTDQYDRPTAGMLHLCIDGSILASKDRAKSIVTIQHEVGHALGFNSRSMAHFRHSDGTPITERVNGEVPEVEIECTGPSSGRRIATVALPSSKILGFRTVRGGVRVAEIRTPSVRQVVRNHFDCQNLSGAELESGEVSPLAGDPREAACIGDHWERRLFKNDLMNPVVDSVDYSPYISTVTLAYFADSGWYQVDLSMAELAATWGRAAGCGFVEDRCIGENGQVAQTNKPFFCNSAPKRTNRGLIQKVDGCTPDLSRKAACSLGQYDTDLPQEYRYFNMTYGSTVGGSDPFIDYCPTYTGFQNGLCTVGENAAVLQVNRLERFGQRNSRCLSSNSASAAMCLPIACVIETRSLHVKIDGKWQICPAKDVELKVDNEFVVCPDPKRVCPTFYCHHDCLGTAEGRCDYKTGNCVCKWYGEGENTNGNATIEDFTLDISLSSTFTGSQLKEKTGVCKPKNSAAIAQQAMPHEDSSLLDIYVETEEELEDETPLPWFSWQKITVVVVVSAFGAFVFLKYQSGVSSCTAPCRSRGSDDGDADGIPADDTTPVNPNKHKMIAAVLVDMRMNGEGSVAPTNQTAPSLCGVGTSLASGSVAGGDASLRAPSLGDRASLFSEDVPGEHGEEHVDVLANPTQDKEKPTMRKRRFKDQLR